MSEYKYDVQGVRVRKSVERTIDGQLRRLELMVHSKYFVTEKQTLLDGSGLPGTKTAVNNVYLNGVRIASLDSNGLTKYYHANNVDSVKVVTDEAGAAISRTEYLPYGETFAREGDLTFAPKYNGQALDQESNLYFFNARHYDPEIARFVTADTVTDGPMTVKGWNRYMYVGGNPIMYKDPTGHEGVGDIMQDAALTSGEKILMGGGGKDVDISPAQSKEIETQLGGAYKRDGSNLKAAEQKKEFVEQQTSSRSPRIQCPGCHHGNGYVERRSFNADLNTMIGKLRQIDSRLKNTQNNASLSAWKPQKRSAREGALLEMASAQLDADNAAYESSKEEWTDEDKIYAIAEVLATVLPVTRLARLGSFVSKGGSFARSSGILRDAAKFKGNFNLGSGTTEEVLSLGRAWVGSGARLSSNGKALISQNGLRRFRLPSYKPKWKNYQANFEEFIQAPGSADKLIQIRNGHLHIK